MLFYWNHLSRHQVLGQDTNLDLLLCTEFELEPAGLLRYLDKVRTDLRYFFRVIHHIPEDAEITLEEFVVKRSWSNRMNVMNNFIRILKTFWSQETTSMQNG